jgi:hypothetical protein
MDYRQPIEPAILVLAVAGAIPLRHLRPGLAPAHANEWLGMEPSLLTEPE